MCENAPRPHEKHEFEGPRVPKWRPRPFWNELFFYLIFGSVFVLFWEPFWSILEAKILQKCGLKITCGKMDFHVTLWVPWGVTIFKEPRVNLHFWVAVVHRIPPSSRGFLLTIAYCPWVSVTNGPIGYRSFIGHGHRPWIQHARRQEGRRIILLFFI